MSQSQSSSSVNLYHNGTEVIVNLSPDTVVQVKINEAEFIVKGKERDFFLDFFESEVFRFFRNCTFWSSL